MGDNWDAGADMMEGRMADYTEPSNSSKVPAGTRFDGQSEKGAKLMQDFGSGATRSSDAHKIDFEGHLHPEVLHYFGEYMHKHRVQRDGNVRASDNWQKGIPLHKYMKSLVRHTLDLWRAWRGYKTFNPDTGKPQSLGELGAAILFNVQGILLELIRVGATEKQYVTEQARRDIEHGGHPTAVFDSTRGYPLPREAAARQLIDKDRERGLSPDDRYMS